MFGGRLLALRGTMVTHRCRVEDPRRCRWRQLDRIAAQTRHRRLSTVVERYIRPAQALQLPSAATSACDLDGAVDSHRGQEYSPPQRDLSSRYESPLRLGRVSPGQRCQ